MKKTIAKIMAAAMVLSTVVAPNVNAATAFTNVANGGPVNFTELYLAQTTATTGNNVATYPLIGATNDLVGSRSNPVDAGFTTTTNGLGNITSVKTDLSIIGNAVGVAGNIVYYDTATNNIVAIVSNADTKVKYSEWGTSGVTNDKISSYKALAAGNITGVDTAKKKADGATYDDTQSFGSGVLTYAQKKGILNDTVKVSDIDAVVANDGTTGTITSSAYKQVVSLDGVFEENKYIGGDVFNGFTIDADGSIRLTVANPSSVQDALINSAFNSIDPIVLKLRMTFAANAFDNATNAQITPKEVWIRLANEAQSTYDGYVILHKDNGQNEKVGVNYTATADGYATITRVNTTKIEADSAKGGRLYLDYVYDRTNTSASTVTTNGAFKIREIGSRVFKGGKFQQISGLDGGAKWIRNIHNGAFRKCKQLKKVNLGDNKKLRKINEKAFYDCKKLATVKLDGRGLKQVGSKAFSGCKSNITFKIKGSSSQAKKAWAKIKKQAPKKAKYSKF